MPVRVSIGCCCRRTDVEFRPGTDVASEMTDVIQALDNCKKCIRAGQAAVDMLAVSGNKLPSDVCRSHPFVLSTNVTSVRSG